jgi:hypothetical protein
MLPGVLFLPIRFKLIRKETNIPGKGRKRSTFVQCMITVISQEIGVVNRKL